ncbi:DMT family transporter [Paenibacillus apiarius]|nr:DMT family transporter [Paenibacillus apiarius]MBN3522688.1 DMT family transporter [Paenibacillus apiarius]
MKFHSSAAGHLAALLTILIWGTTFISTKVLLVDFSPFEILFFRFIIGYAALLAVYPRFVKSKNIREELLFAAAGFCGVTMYFLLENIGCTRRVFFYGLLFMLPPLLLSDSHLGLERFAEPVNLLNILFLGLGASALCFVTWNWCVGVLGAIKETKHKEKTKLKEVDIP